MMNPQAKAAYRAAKASVRFHRPWIASDCIISSKKKRSEFHAVPFDIRKVRRRPLRAQDMIQTNTVWCSRFMIYEEALEAALEKALKASRFPCISLNLYLAKLHIFFAAVFVRCPWLPDYF